MGTRASAGMPKCGYGHHRHQLTESLSHTKRWTIHSARCFVTAGSITSNYLMWNFHHCPPSPPSVVLCFIPVWDRIMSGNKEKFRFDYLFVAQSTINPNKCCWD